jgi:DNA primase
LIPHETVAEIIETSRIEEVVGDFVALKKRGVNYIGNCPFHNEKTPSFTVSPAKGIYKCFGCGEGGNSVNFVMDHEHQSYPEALKYLAQKYNIEIEEEELTSEQQEQLNERESLFIVIGFAQQYFSDQMMNTDAGKSIALSYFKERGFREDIIEKFQLGYCQEDWDKFTKAALAKGYKLKYLEQAGLTKVRDDKQFDFFKGRVIFPIHNLTGKVIAFGARTLKKDKKTPKYLNSPENDIYNKSKVLYGIYFAKKDMIAEDNCYLVEGYTDVISMYQSDVKNVVSSSGTSLTTEQIRLIRRYTSNITILFDGDAAGIKASFRGIDMILKEGMNVKVVLFPDGEDPDSYAKSVSNEELKKYITEQAKDFIIFKTDLIIEETQNDPVKRSALIHDIVNSIALIPDQITRSVYIKECSRQFEIGEQSLINELNKVRRKSLSKKKDEVVESLKEETINLVEKTEKVSGAAVEIEWQEYHLIRMLLQYPEEAIPVIKNEEEGEEKKEEEEPVMEDVKVPQYIVSELMTDTIILKNDGYQKIMEEVVTVLKENETFGQSFFFNHMIDDIRKMAIDFEMLSEKYQLSHNWKDMHKIYVTTEQMKLSVALPHVITSYKSRIIDAMIFELQKQLKANNSIESFPTLEEINRLLALRVMINEPLERTVIR